MATVPTSVGADPVAVPAGAGARAPFPSLFVDAADRPPSYDIRRLGHHALGAMNLFPVPVRHDGGVAYRAVVA